MHIAQRLRSGWRRAVGTTAVAFGIGVIASTSLPMWVEGHGTRLVIAAGSAVAAVLILRWDRYRNAPRAREH